MRNGRAAIVAGGLVAAACVVGLGDVGAPEAPPAASPGGAASASASASPAPPVPVVEAPHPPRARERDLARAAAEVRASRSLLLAPGVRSAQAPAGRPPGPEAAAAAARASGADGRVPRARSSGQALALLEAAGMLRAQGAAWPSGSGRVQRARLFKQGRPVFNRHAVLERATDGTITGRAGAATLPLLRGGPVSLGREEAVERTHAHLDVDARALRGAPRARLGWLALPGGTVPAWRVVLPAARPFGSWQVTLDARSGEVLSVVDRVRRATGSGSVYDPNVALAPTPATVPLFGLDGSGALAGSFTRVVDARAPAAFVPSLDFLFPPADPRFVQTSVYRGLTDTALFAQTAGFPPFAVPVPAFVNLPDPVTGSGEFNNAFYDPVLRVFGFGNGDGVVTANLGTDLDVAAHEMAHHLFEEQVRPDILSSADPVLAMSEGVADTFSALVGGDPDVGESTIPGQPYLRTLVNTRVFPDDLDPDPHETGLVYGATNWELMQLLGAPTFTALLLDALARLPSDAVETEYRDAFLQANLATRGGQDQAAIQAIFTARGFDDLELPPEFLGFLEPGLPQAHFLPDSPFDPDPATWNLHVFVFSEFPGSTSVTFQTTGTGDVDLVVFPLNDLDPNAPFAVSENIGSNETIVLTPSTTPSVHHDDDWIVAVFDFPDGFGSSYTLSVQATLPPADMAIDGPPFQGAIASQGEVDLVTFDNPVPGAVVRLEAEALAPTLDPLVGVVSVDGFQVLGVDDDSGPGTDALLQGVRLPAAGPYAVVVLSAVADVDPTVGTGAYELRLTTCPNTGPDFDGDGLADVCDDDDDDDGFVDADDSGDLDPLLCADLDADGCDDCSSGAFDFFADGPDADADGLCDPGDVDDDNDGCPDAVDPAPTTASADGDLDFLGDDCDNCPATANADQADAEGDGAGDACDNCVQVANPSQADADADLFGNACDCDFDQDGACTIADFNVFLPDFQTGIDSGVGTDMDGDGAVGIADFNLFLPGFAAGSPGP